MSEKYDSKLDAEWRNDIKSLLKGMKIEKLLVWF